MLVARGDYSSLQRILKQTFEIDGETEVSKNMKLIGRILWIWMILWINEKVLSNASTYSLLQLA